MSETAPFCVTLFSVLVYHTIKPSDAALSLLSLLSEPPNHHYRLCQCQQLQPAACRHGAHTRPSGLRSMFLCLARFPPHRPSTIFASFTSTVFASPTPAAFEALTRHRRRATRQHQRHAPTSLLLPFRPRRTRTRARSLISFNFKNSFELAC